MEEFIQKMVEKVGLDRATADKVIEFLKDHSEDAGLKDKLPGGLGDKLGGMF